jgi:hypothetical protein
MEKLAHSISPQPKFFPVQQSTTTKIEFFFSVEIFSIEKIQMKIKNYL